MLYADTTSHDLSTTASVLSAARLSELTSLNLSYLALLELLRRSTAATQNTILGMNRRYVDDLRALGRVERLRIAACPYALFRLRLQSSDTAAAVYEHEAAHWSPRERAAQSRFLTSALVYAWHVARSDMLAARTTLGLSAATCLAMARLSVTHLHLAGARGARLLTTRFVRYPPFWPGVIRAAAKPLPEQLAVSRLAGFQWMAMQDPD